MLSPHLVKLETSEMTDIPYMLRLNCFWDNFVSRAPILVSFFTFEIRNHLHTNLSISSATH